MEATGAVVLGDMEHYSPRRLGMLLHDARARVEMSLDDAATRSNCYDAATLEAFEQGRHRPSVKDLTALSRLYDTDITSLAAPRDDLVIDLVSGCIQLGETTAVIPESSGDHHDVVAEYLSILYAVRRIEERQPVDLRVADLEVMCDALRLTPHQLVAELNTLMQPAIETDLAARPAPRPPAVLIGSPIHPDIARALDDLFDEIVDAPARPRRGAKNEKKWLEHHEQLRRRERQLLGHIGYDSWTAYRLAMVIPAQPSWSGTAEELRRAFPRTY